MNIHLCIVVANATVSDKLCERRILERDVLSSFPAERNSPGDDAQNLLAVPFMRYLTGMRYCLYILILTARFSLVATAAVPLLDDPARDGWNTEVLSGEAGKQLEVFAGLLSQTDPIAAAQLVGLTAPDFACRSLRPVTLETVFRDGAITVRRPQPAVAGTENQAAPTGDGVAVLQQLRRPYTHGYIPRAELKVTGIEMTTAGFETVVLVSFFGHAAAGSLEETATWRCGWQPQQAGPPLLISMTTVKYEQITLATEHPTLFSDCSQAVMGANACWREQFMHSIAYWVQRIEFMQGIDINGYLGIAVGDVNGDGLDDVYVAQEGGLPNRLLRHNPDGTVTDISAAAGVDWMAATSGVLLADFDNDGDQDLVCATNEGLLFNKNDTIGGGRNHAGRFSEFTLLNVAADAFSLAAVDYDNDGDLDIFACVYFRDGNRGNVVAFPVPYFDATNGGSNVLLRNDGGFKFTDVTELVGLDEGRTRYALGAAFEDYDNDGDQDLYVANDFGRNLLYRNDADLDTGARRFVEVAQAAGCEDRGFSMSAAWSDVDHNGWMDLYVANMYSAAGNRIVFQDKFVEGNAPMRHKMQYLTRGNSLLTNQKGAFTDASADAGVMMGRWSWSSPFCDINNDSWEDILVGNGFLTNIDEHDL